MWILHLDSGSLSPLHLASKCTKTFSIVMSGRSCERGIVVGPRDGDGVGEAASAVTDGTRVPVGR